MRIPHIGPQLLARNIYAGDLIEKFLISAVSTVLLVRFILNLTGFPRISDGDIHIAHVLWGGLLMTMAIGLLLSFLNAEVRRFGAVVGGIGFGLFIDELGKFVTSNNNYFFQPAVAFIYVVFVLLFLASRVMERYLEYSEREYVVNALELTKEVVLHDLDEEEQREALRLLDETGLKSPFIESLRDFIASIEPEPLDEPSLPSRIRVFSHDLYSRLIEQAWFIRLVIVYFVISSLISFIHAAWRIPLDFLLHQSIEFEIARTPLTFSQWGELFFSLLAGFFVLAGTYYIRYRGRLDGYMMYRRAVLVSIFLTQFFVFYREQFMALFGLGMNIVTLIVLEYMIGEERGMGGGIEFS